MPDGVETSAPAASTGDTPLSHSGVGARRAGARPLPVGLIGVLRPKQWLKNLLLLAAPGAAGVLSHGDVIADVAVAFAAFCLVSSGTYVLNDIHDRKADRLHPTKRLRPIAAGAVPLSLAWPFGVVLLLTGLGVAAAVRLEFLAVVAMYVAVTTTYTLWLKHEPVLDIVAIASCFIIRAVAGGVAVDVPLSRWFLIVASFGSLFVVAGKRYAEHEEVGTEGGVVRATLETYSRRYLRDVWTMASSIAVAAYCLWAFEQAPADAAVPLYELSIVPFVTFMLRYALLLEAGHGGAPEDVITRDRVLLALVAIWAAVFGSGVYFLN